jgi:HAMP domain-containing protein
MRQKHHGISYVHYTSAFALIVIGITLTVGYLPARQQARAAHEQAQTEKLLAILNTAALLLEPFDPTTQADFPGPRDRPEDLPEVTRKLQEIAARHGMDRDDGSCLVIIRLDENGAPMAEPFTANKPRGQCWRMLVPPSSNHSSSEAGPSHHQPRIDEQMALNNGLGEGPVEHGNYLARETHMATAAVALYDDTPAEGRPALLSGSMAFDYDEVRVWPGFLQVLPYLVVAAIFIGALSVFFAGHIISPIWTMVNAQKRLADGKLEFRLVKRRRRDEFGDLFRGFNETAESLEQQVKQAREGQEAGAKEKGEEG